MWRAHAALRSGWPRFRGRFARVIELVGAVEVLAVFPDVEAAIKD